MLRRAAGGGGAANFSRARVRSGATAAQGPLLREGFGYNLVPEQN
ncbi:hypothetical protein [Arthrobacter sp. GMC3]|nr:hypothetical protein [Arthrobacter sp. GMC3]